MVFHSFAAVLGNDLAIQAYREGKVPFPDGAIIASLHYRHVPSEENNKVFGQAQSFVPGTPTNIQFMVKGTKKYAATGGWGFAHFQDGKPDDESSGYLSTEKAQRELGFNAGARLNAA
jgi:hypothetical protein